MDDSPEDVFPLPQAGEAKGEEAALKRSCITAAQCMYATIKSDSQPYLFRYSRDTNCEYDSARAFERREQRWYQVLCNMSAEDIRQSVDEYRREIAKAQIVIVPGRILSRR